MAAVNRRAAKVMPFRPQNHHPSNVSRSGVCAWGRVADYRCDQPAEFSVMDVADGSFAYATCADHLAGAARYIISQARPS